MVGYYTKVAEAEAMKSQDAETVASTFFNRWICQHGVPESVHSDQGPNFESRLFTELCKTFGIAKTRTTPGHLHGTGQVERTNRTLVGLLKAFTKGAKPEDWDLSLGRALLAHRATGHEMRVPSDIFLPSKETTPDNVPQYVLRLKEGMEDSALKSCRVSEKAFDEELISINEKWNYQTKLGREHYYFEYFNGKIAGVLQKREEYDMEEVQRMEELKAKLLSIKNRGKEMVTRENIDECVDEIMSSPTVRFNYAVSERGRTVYPKNAGDSSL
ncbi:Gag-Pol polyprotein [Taenia solium]|eukprot:TsM_000070300 transcript=TsM_000070300 gene=TsM_000070300